MNTLPSIQAVIDAYGLQPKKSLGQHFLLDPSLLQQIVRSAGNIENMHLIEIGPGPAGLTRAMLDSSAADVTVIEKDSRCIKALGLLQEIHKERLSIIEGDALQIDLPDHVTAPRAIIANLPYNVGTAMLQQWLMHIKGNADAYAHLTLMFQKEVAERICAAPGSKAYGRLSVIAQWLCSCSYLFDVPAEAFSPPPKVTSSIVHLVPRKHPIEVEFSSLEKLLHTVFSQRRKMLRVSLKSLSDDVEVLCAACSIDSKARPETLTLEQFCLLANQLAYM